MEKFYNLRVRYQENMVLVSREYGFAPLWQLVNLLISSISIYDLTKV